MRKRYRQFLQSFALSTPANGIVNALLGGICGVELRRMRVDS